LSDQKALVILALLIVIYGVSLKSEDKGFSLFRHLKHLARLFGFCTVLLSIFYTPTILGNSTQQFVVDNHKIEVQLPEGWVAQANTLGIQLVILGPKQKDIAPVLGLSTFNSRNLELTPQAFREAHSSYEREQKAALKSAGHQWTETLRYQTQRLTGLGEVHIFGVRYRRFDRLFTERNLFFNCNSQISELSILEHSEQAPIISEQINTILNSLKCSPATHR
jgi:hypothetical protein